jgi:hypothetical protein
MIRKNNIYPQVRFFQAYKIVFIYPTFVRSHFSNYFRPLIVGKKAPLSIDAVLGVFNSKF